MNHTQKIRDAIQQLLNDLDDEGWQVSQFVIAMGLERFANGQLESVPWLWAPPDQPDWQTGGLLDEAQEIRAGLEVDDE